MRITLLKSVRALSAQRPALALSEFSKIFFGASSERGSGG
jgi:hypothetical protein